MDFLILSNDEKLFLKKSSEKENAVLNVGLLYIKNSNQKILSLLKKIQEKFSKKKKLDCICVMTENSGYEEKLSFFVSYLYSILENEPLFYKPSYHLSLPSSTLTISPSIVPVVNSDVTEWKNEKHVCVLPGWEFYGLDWILHRWDAELGSFDETSFLSSPLYPKDIYNKLIHPSLVISYMDMWVRHYGISNLKKNFYALYCFYKDKLGHALLHFFYEETIKPSCNKTLYKKIQCLYHNTCPFHPYRKFLFFQSYCLSESKKFHLGMYISQYFSYHGMFVAKDFLNQYIDTIIKTFKIKTKMLFFGLNHYTTGEIKKKLLEAFDEIYSNTEYSVNWISRDFLENSSNAFLKYIYYNWHDIDRNIFLWDLKSIRYNDSQHRIGINLTYLYSAKQVTNFINS